MHLITKEHVTITVTPEPEEMEIRDSLSSGDAEYAEAEETLAKELEARLDRGDVWAWCCIAVKVEFALPSGDTLLTSTHYLGACSYDSESDFRNQIWTIDGEPVKDAGYYHDMVNEGIEELNASLLEMLGQVQALRSITFPSLGGEPYHG